MNLMDFLIGLEDYRINGLFAEDECLCVIVFARSDQQAARRLAKAADWIGQVMTPELRANLLPRLSKRPAGLSDMPREQVV